MWMNGGWEQGDILGVDERRLRVPGVGKDQGGALTVEFYLHSGSEKACSVETFAVTVIIQTLNPTMSLSF